MSSEKRRMRQWLFGVVQCAVLAWPTGHTATAASKSDALISQVVPFPGTKPDATLRRQARVIVAEPGQLALSEDHLVTDRVTRVQLYFLAPEAQLWVGAGSSVLIRSLKPDQTLLSLIEGAVRVTLSNLGVGRHDVEVEDLGVVAAAHGTDFVVEHTADGGVLTVVEGEVAVRDPRGGTAVVRALQQLRWSTAGVLGPVQSITAEATAEPVRRTTPGVEEMMRASDVRPPQGLLPWGIRGLLDDVEAGAPSEPDSGPWPLTPRRPLELELGPPPSSNGRGHQGGLE